LFADGEKLAMETDRTEPVLSVVDLARVSKEVGCRNSWGFVRSAERDHRTEAQKAQQDANERTSSAALEVRSLLQAALLTLREKILSFGRKTMKSIELAQTLAADEAESSRVKGSEAVSELNGLMRAIEQNLGTGFGGAGAPEAILGQDLTSAH